MEVIKVLKKPAVRIAAKVTAYTILGGTAVLGAMETEEKVVKLLKIVADKAVK